MKKWILLILSCALLSTPAYATVTTNYLEDNFETTQEHYSISGASDPQYPLTLNGEVVETTESGYFSCYVDLQEGENVFVLDNGSDKKEITITRKAVNAAADSDTASDVAADEFTEMDAVGVVNRNHPTVRSRPDEAYDDLIGPYVKDTLLHITGKNSEYYRTANGAYLYFDSVDLAADQTYTANRVRSVTASGNTVEIQMDRATEYKCDLTSDGLELTLYDTDAASGKITVSGETVKAIEKESSNPATYQIKFSKKYAVVGYMCYYEDGKLKIELNQRTVLKDQSLNGVKIVLDAGHGGAQNGAAGLGASPEKDITLSITKYLGEYLSSQGATVVYTRTDDSTVELAARSAQIIAEKPDLSVSIHCNSMNPWVDYNQYSGTLNLYTHDSPTRFVEKLTEELAGSTYRKQNLALTRTSICPAVLIETGYISNPVDCEYLSKDANQKELAEKIGCAIQQYFYGLEQADSSQEKVPLSDLDGHWAQDAITSVYEKGVVSGYEDGTFQPEKTISRAEFLQVLYNVYGNGESADISFSDVPESAWYYDCVKWGVASGLVTGYGDYTFRADQEITREEAAVILSRCSGLPAGGSSVAFKDSNAIAGWAKDGVAAVSKAGVMQGSSSGYFNPKKLMTRAEAAVIASRLL